jgi:hypothetical protein
MTAPGEDPSGWGIGLQSMFLEMLLPHRASNSILSIQDETCSTVGIEYRWRSSQLLESTSGFLAARAVTRRDEDWPADCLELHLAALARREQMLVLFLVHAQA